MATTTVTDAVVIPQARGTGLTQEEDMIDAAGEALLSEYKGEGSYVGDGMDFTNHNTSNDTVDVSAGYCFIVDDTSSTGGSRGSGGNAQLQSNISSGYDTEIPNNQIYCVIFPTATTVDVNGSQLNKVWVNITDVQQNNAVEVRSDGGSGTTGTPADTYLKIGEANPDDASQDTRANDLPNSRFKFNYHGQVSSTPSDADIGTGNTAVYSKTGGDIYAKAYGGNETSLTSGSSTDVSDSGSVVVSNTGDINFSSNLTVTDDTDGTVTVDASAASGTSLPDLLSQGLVVASASGTFTTHDPANTSTPVNDAITDIEGSGSSGIIWLPPGTTQDTGPIAWNSNAQAISIRGTGFSTASSGGGGGNCVLEITGSNAGMDISGFGPKHMTMRDFVLKGTNQSYPALWFNASTTPRMHNMNNIRFDSWSDSTNGAIHFDGSHTFSCHWQNLMFAVSNSGPCMYMNSDGPNFVEITNMYADHKGGNHPVIDCNNQRMNVNMGLLNIGGDHDQALSLDSMTFNGQLQIDYINYEPNGVTDTNKPVIKKAGNGYFQVDCLSVNGYSGMDSVESAYQLYGNNNRIGHIVERGLTNGYDIGNPIDVQNTLSGSWYFGPTGDVVNNTGSNTGLQCLEDAGTEA